MKIGVTTWSLNRDDPFEGIRAAGDAGFDIVQTGFFQRAHLFNCDPVAMSELARGMSIEVDGVFVAFEGEDYASPESLAASGGLAPDDLVEDRLAQVRRGAKIASELGAPHVIVHAGTVPDPNESDAQVMFRKLVERVAEAANATQACGRKLLLETGREPVANLVALIDALDTPDVAGVNFDPANLVVFGVDDPARAVRTLKGKIAAVHVKDALGPVGDARMGSPSPLGMGDVGVARVVNKLRTIQYQGPLLIECNRGHGGVEAVRSARDYLESLH